MSTREDGERQEAPSTLDGSGQRNDTIRNTGGPSAIITQEGRVVYPDESLRRAAWCIRDVTRRGEVDVLEEYVPEPEMRSADGKVYIYASPETVSNVEEAADLHILGEYRNLALTWERKGQSMDGDEGQALQECAEELRNVFSADRRFRG